MMTSGGKIMVRILLVEPVASLREAIRRVLSESGEFEIVGELPGARDAISACELLQPSMILMDVESRDGISGIDMAKVLHERFPAVSIVLCALSPEITYSERSKALGAKGYFNLSCDLSEILAYLQAISRGDSVFIPSKKFPAPVGLAEFTSREKEILRHICRGETTDTTARELFISENTE